MLKKDLGRQIRLCRLKVNKTQEELSSELQVSKHHLGRIERGVSFPSLELVEKICRALHVSPGQLFDFETAQGKDFRSRNDSDDVDSTIPASPCVDSVEHAEGINRQLQKALAEKDMIFSIIAQDLKSPISGYLSLTEVLAEDIDSMSIKDIRRLSIEMHKGAKNLYALLNNLLQWSRVRQGMVEYTPKHYDLEDLLNTSLDMVRVVARQKGINVDHAIPHDIAVFVDHSMVSTIVRNLLFNAVKFTEQGGNVLLTAKKAGKMVRIAVQDDGIGMYQKTLSRIFAIDHKPAKRGTQGETGSGLGLMLCKEFVSRHGGQIWLESNVGKGTTVYFTLPSSE